MAKHKKYPKVLLVGRTNVGKSTLFNRLVNEKKSIVFDREGVTRDYIQQTVSWKDSTFDLIDTGGISTKKMSDPLWQKAQEKVQALLHNAALLLFVVDGKNGLTEEDRALARQLHKTQKPIVLLINKADCQNALEENAPEFYALGCKTIIPVSAIHSIGISKLLETIVEKIKTADVIEVESPSHNIAIIGRPNVGKSSLMNFLVDQERSIVSDIAGTTREAIAQNIFYCNDLLQITDTAGVRKQARINDDLESLMVKSTFAAVSDADTIVLIIDAAEGKISDQELKLLFYAYEHKKFLLVVFNKTDLLNDYTTLTLEQSVEAYDFILSKFPVLYTSCLTKKNTGKVFKELTKMWDRCNEPLNSTKVNEIVQADLARMILYHTKIKLRVFKIRVATAPIPTFILHVNKPEFFGTSELNCIENILRKHFDLKGCPIQFNVKSV